MDIPNRNQLRGWVGALSRREMAKSDIEARLKMIGTEHGVGIEADMRFLLNVELNAMRGQGSTKNAQDRAAGLQQPPPRGSRYKR